MEQVRWGCQRAGEREDGSNDKKTWMMECEKSYEEDLWTTGSRNMNRRRTVEGMDQTDWCTPPYKEKKTDTHYEVGTEAIPEGLATGRTAAVVAVSAALSAAAAASAAVAVLTLASCHRPWHCWCRQLLPAAAAADPAAWRSPEAAHSAAAELVPAASAVSETHQ